MKRTNKKKIRILVVIRWPVGGIRSFIKYTYNNFANRHHYHFIILCPNYYETRALLEDLKNLNVSYIPIGTDFNSFRLLKEIVIAGFSQDISLIHSHGMTAGVHASIIARLFGIPHMLTVHETLYEDQFKGALKTEIKLKLLSFLLSMTDVIHLVSKDAEDNILKYLPNLMNGRTKLAPILNGIDTSKYLNSDRRDLRNELSLSEEIFLLGFLGRFMPVKGFRYLIDAFECVLKRTNEISKKPILLTFGSGAFIRKEMERAKRKGLENYIISLPFIQDASTTLKGLDVLVMPSLAEACGILAMEGMVSGIPVIGTNCLGLREVLKDTPNVMVPPGDSSALAEALIQEMNHPSRHKAENFKEEAALRFDVRKQAVKLEARMAELIKNRN
jgi:glycosyltransferase involved in cell wall biosynthesis